MKILLRSTLRIGRRVTKKPWKPIRATDVGTKLDRSFVAVFPDEMAAKEGAQALKDRCADGSITLIGLTVISKDPRGGITIAEKYQENTHGATIAALIGALAGWVAGGPVAAVIFAAGGALFGLSADMIHRGDHAESVKRASRELRGGRSAVIACLSEAPDPSISAMMNCLDGRVMAPGA